MSRPCQQPNCPGTLRWHPASRIHICDTCKAADNSPPRSQPDSLTHRRCGQRVAEVPPMDERDDETQLWCARCMAYLRDDEVELEVVEEAEKFDEACGPMVLGPRENEK